MRLSKGVVDDDVICVHTALYELLGVVGWLLGQWCGRQELAKTEQHKLNGREKKILKTDRTYLWT